MMDEKPSGGELAGDWDCKLLITRQRIYDFVRFIPIRQSPINLARDFISYLGTEISKLEGTIIACIRASRTARAEGTL